MSLYRPPLTVVMIMVLFSLTACSSKPNFSDSNKIYTDYANQKSTKELFIKGEYKKANQILKHLIPDSEKSFYDYFILGNMMYQNSPEDSYKYMLKAESLNPNYPRLLYERGIHEHRKGNFKKAQEYYERFADTKLAALNPLALNTYLTHTYLMTNSTAKAISTWEKLNYEKNKRAIERALFVVFSKLNQEELRTNIIHDINSGDTFKTCDLHYLDANWITGWNSTRKRYEFLKFDLELAIKKLKPHQEPVFRACMLFPKLRNRDSYVLALKEIGMLSEKALLPDSSIFINWSFRELIKHKVISADALLRVFEPQLLARYNRNKNDEHMIATLALLYLKTNQIKKVQSLAEYGWKELKSERFALLYVITAHGQDPSLSKKLVREALQDFPSSPYFNTLKWTLSNPASTTLDEFSTITASLFTDLNKNILEDFLLESMLLENQLVMQMNTLKNWLN